MGFISGAIFLFGNISPPPPPQPMPGYVLECLCSSEASFTIMLNTRSDWLRLTVVYDIAYIIT